MASSSTWLPVHKAEKFLGVDRKELFRMRDDGTLKLGTHYAAFPETRSRGHLPLERLQSTQSSCEAECSFLLTGA